MNDIASDGEAPAALTEKYGGGDAGPMSVRTWLRLLSCSMVVEKRLRRRFIEQYGTTLPRFDVLAALDRRPDGITMGELSQMLLVSNGNVTALVRQLQSDGHVTLDHDPDDRRSLIVRLKPQGAAHFVELAAAHHRWIADMFGGVSVEQQRALYDLLSVVKASIAAEGKGA